MAQAAQNTTKFRKHKNNRLYGLGTAKHGFSFAIFGVRNGIPLLETGIAIGVLIVWSFIFSLIGLTDETLARAGTVIHYAPPILLVWYFSRNNKETDQTPLERLEHIARRKILEPDYYISNEEAEVPQVFILSTSYYTPAPRKK